MCSRSVLPDVGLSCAVTDCFSLCRMMVFGVLTLVLSWASLGADLALAVVSRLSLPL